MDYSRVCSQWMEDTELLCLIGSEESRIMLLQRDYTSESLGFRYTDKWRNFQIFYVVISVCLFVPRDHGNVLSLVLRVLIEWVNFYRE